MIRIAGVNIPEQKRIVIALTYVKGVGSSLSKKILAQMKIDEDTKAKDVKDEQIEQIRKIIEEQNVVEGELRVDLANNIKRLKNIGSYRGSRHAKGLPARGQRTKTNARTKRGKKVTVGSGRKKATEKT